MLIYSKLQTSSRCVLPENGRFFKIPQLCSRWPIVLFVPLPKFSAGYASEILSLFDIHFNFETFTRPSNYTFRIYRRNTRKIMRKTKDETSLRFLKQMKWFCQKNFDLYKARSCMKKNQKKCSRMCQLEQVSMHSKCTWHSIVTY